MLLNTYTSAILTGLLALAACSGDRRSPDQLVSGPKNPPPPIVPGDGKVFDPADPIHPKGDGGSRHEPAPGQPNGDDSGNGKDKGKNSQNPGGEPVPEPATMLLVGTGLAGVAIYHRKRRLRVETENDPA